MWPHILLKLPDGSANLKHLDMSNMPQVFCSRREVTHQELHNSRLALLTFEFIMIQIICTSTRTKWNQQ
jgi:hypothetical protein